MGGRSTSAPALLAALLVLALHAPRAEAGILDSLKKKGFELVALAIGNEVDKGTELLAADLEADGDMAAGAAVRNSGDTFTHLVETSIDATACSGSVSLGAAIGSIIPVFGTALGAVAGALLNPACKDAVRGAVDTAQSALATGAALVDMADPSGAEAAPQCVGNEVVMESTEACITYCDSLTPGCSTWYMSQSCCLCKPYCDTTAAAPGAATTLTPSTPTTSTADPATAATCGTILQDIDLFGGDIVPVTTKWADTAVSAATPEDCCEACTLYSYCNAWTFTQAANCKERLPNASGCCFLKKATGWIAEPATGMISGTTLGPAAASCSIEYDTDLAQGDLITSDEPDTVVATFSDADCCNTCATTAGCGAWTMTPPSNCVDRVPGAVGCCFLKAASGWVRTNDDSGTLTSGILLAIGG